MLNFLPETLDRDPRYKAPVFPTFSVGSDLQDIDDLKRKLKSQLDTIKYDILNTNTPFFAAHSRLYDFLQPFLGVFKIILGILQVAVFPFVFLFTLRKGLPQALLQSTYSLSQGAVHLAYGALQLITTPFTYLFRIPLREIKTWQKTNSEIQAYRDLVAHKLGHAELFETVASFPAPATASSLFITLYSSRCALNTDQINLLKRHQDLRSLDGLLINTTNLIRRIMTQEEVQDVVAQLLTFSQEELRLLDQALDQIRCTLISSPAFNRDHVSLIIKRFAREKKPYPLAEAVNNIAKRHEKYRDYKKEIEEDHWVMSTLSCDDTGFILDHRKPYRAFQALIQMKEAYAVDLSVHVSDFRWRESDFKRLLSPEWDKKMDLVKKNSDPLAIAKVFTDRGWQMGCPGHSYFTCEYDPVKRYLPRIMEHKSPICASWAIQGLQKYELITDENIEKILLNENLFRVLFQDKRVALMHTNWHPESEECQSLLWGRGWSGLVLHDQTLFYLNYDSKQIKRLETLPEQLHSIREKISMMRLDETLFANDDQYAVISKYFWHFPRDERIQEPYTTGHHLSKEALQRFLLGETLINFLTAVASSLRQSETHLSRLNTSLLMKISLHISPGLLKSKDFPQISHNLQGFFARHRGAGHMSADVGNTQTQASRNAAST